MGMGWLVRMDEDRMNGICMMNVMNVMNVLNVMNV